MDDQGPTGTGVLPEALQLGRCSSCGGGLILGDHPFGWCDWCREAPISSDPGGDHYHRRPVGSVCPVVRRVERYLWCMERIRRVAGPRSGWSPFTRREHSLTPRAGFRFTHGMQQAEFHDLAYHGA